MEGARVILEVTAGMVPGTVDPEFTKRWGIASEEWETAGGEGSDTTRAGLLFERLGRAQAYVCELALCSASGQAPNWVRLDWLWL